jgi:chromosome partitioning related protein ParA
MIVISVISTKGGVGKTTLSANLGSILADFGYRVLLIDADIQPSLSKYFPLVKLAKNGLTNMIETGIIDDDCISRVDIKLVSGVLDIVRSDSPDGSLNNFLISQVDRGFRMSKAINCPYVSDNYDVVIIDTQGSVGALLDAAILASTHLLSPVVPETISAREFVTGTIDLMKRFEMFSTMGIKIPVVKAVLYRQDRTTDAKTIGNYIRNAYFELSGRAEVLSTVVPQRKAYTEAATRQIPVHHHDNVRTGQSACASEVMHELIYELFPNLTGLTAGGVNHE